MKYLAILLLLVGCDAKVMDVPADAKYVQPKVPLVTTVTFHRYSISDSEHVVLIDVPDLYVPRRCMVFIDDTTKTSHMNCNFDSIGEAMPEQGE